MNTLQAQASDDVRAAGDRSARDWSIPMSAALWFVSRLAVVVAAAHWHDLLSDVRYWTINLDSGAGPHAALVEYPVPAYAFLWVPWSLAHVIGAMPGPTYLVAALAADGLLHGALIMSHRGRRGVSAAEWLWIAASPALGAVAVAHFDIAVGVLTACALLVSVRRPIAGAVLMTLAVGLKYTPVVALPGVLARDRWRRRSLAAVALGAVALIASSAALGGVPRIWSPLTWQAERGLQIESVLATPMMLARVWVGDRYPIGLSAHLSYDITGPGVRPMIELGTVALGVLLVVCGALWWRSRRGVGTEAMVWLTIAPLTGFVACIKVFSPQYLLWLTPLVAAGVAITRGPERKRLVWFGSLLLICCVLTQAGPVIELHGLVHDPTSRGGVLAVTMLAVRNVGVVVLAVWGFVRAWTLTASVATDP